MLNIIVAVGENYVIGHNNKLIWHISRDLKRFKKITYGKTIIMGRKTFESLPGILPNRKHVVITRDHNYNVKDENVLVVNNIEDVLRYVDSDEEAFVIGGGEVYKQLLPYCSRLYLTKIAAKKDGDTYFPEFNKDNYNVIECEKHNEDNMEYSFVTLEKF
ncbi:dihydrofolate reductase [Clostridium sp. WILCCON 0269]|uniref:Dihydrofolate reductase n=1 Tax=Candidatus Clostridium eludens TaxID=3381663 RepID=A0ABW8SLB5_9CLOT